MSDDSFDVAKAPSPLPSAGFGRSPAVTETVVLDMATVELIPSKVVLSAIAMVASPEAAIPAFLAAGKSSVAIEGRVRDSLTGETLMMFADREEPAYRIIDVKSVTWWSQARDSIDLWAKQMVELANTPPEEKVKDEPFSVCAPGKQPRSQPNVTINQNKCMRRDRTLKMERNTAVRYLAAIACAGSLAPALPVFGQAASEFEALDPDNPYTGTRVIPGFGYRSKADIDSGGEFGEVGFSVRGGPSFVLGNDIKVNAIASYRYSHYDFSGFGTDPWENIHTFRVTPLAVYNYDEAWTLWGGPTLGFSAEEGADFASSITGGGMVGVSYKLNDTLSFGGGFGIFSQIEDSPRFLPIITANWKFADQWSVRVGFSEVAAMGGIGAEVNYDLNEQWRLGAGVQFQRKRFRLDESGPIPDGVGQDTSVPIYVKAAWQMSPSMTFEGLIGIAAGGEVLVEDNDGQRLAKEDYDPSFLFGLRAVFSF